MHHEAPRNIKVAVNGHRVTISILNRLVCILDGSYSRGGIS